MIPMDNERTERFAGDRFAERRDSDRDTECFFHAARDTTIVKSLPDTPPVHS